MIYVGGRDKTPCNTYGALYTWETAMMPGGKYADETGTGSAWDESWVSSYYFASGAPGATPHADRNNTRGETAVKGGGRGICPANYRRSNGSLFVSRGLAVAYWSSSVSRKDNAWCRNFNSITAQVYRINNDRSYGFSVRCIKD